MPDPALFIDADACPVKAEVMRVAERHQLRVHMVSNSGVRAGLHPLVNAVIVSSAFDAADNWIADNVTHTDIVITADILLASRCLEKGAAVLGPAGKGFTASNIGMALAMRDVMSDLRATGAVSGYNPSFTKQDRSRFLDMLEREVQNIKRRR